MNSGIYIIRNIVNNKIYIGSTSSFTARWAAHKHMLKYNKHHCKYLQNAYNKYSKENFVYEVVCYTGQDLIETEQKWLDFFKPEYNGTLIAGPTFTKGKISKLKGIPRSEEVKRKISEAKKGQPKSDEHKKAISDFYKGRIAWNKGTKHSEEHKANLRKAWIKRKQNQNI